jgi:hypothetical protein
MIDTTFPIFNDLAGCSLMLTELREGSESFPRRGIMEGLAFDCKFHYPAAVYMLLN